MAYREIGVVEVREVLRRWVRGQSVRSIARQCGMDRKSVGRYIEAAEEAGLCVGALDAAVSEELAGRVWGKVQVGAPVTRGSATHACETHREALVKWHAEGCGGPKLAELLKRDHGVQVPLRTLQRFMQSVLQEAQGKDKGTYSVADGEPGEELQVDYVQLGLVRDLDSGTTRRLHAFICTPVVSRYSFVYPCWNETTETTIEALEAAWSFYGGVFAGIVPDNLKAVVIKADPVAPVFHETFVEYSQSRGFLLGPARVRHPQDKGRVENAVKYVQSSLFAGEQLGLIEQWRTHAERWCREVAGLRKHGTTGQQPALHFSEVESSALLPLPTTAWETPRRTTAKVGRDARIRVSNGWYRVRRELIGQEVQVRVDSASVRVSHDHTWVHTFARVAAYEVGGLPVQEGAGAQIAERKPDALLAQASAQGPSVAALCKRLLQRGLWFAQVRKVLAVLRHCERYGGQAVDAACAKLLAVDEDDPVRVERVVRLGLESRPSPPAAEVTAARTGPGKYARDNDTWRTKPEATGGKQDAAARPEAA